MYFIIRIIKKFSCAISGVFHALKTDFSYSLQFFGGIFVIGIFIYFFWPLSKTEILFLGLAWTLVLITELQNSSIESALNVIHPELHKDIGHSKDMAAGAVLTAGFFLLFVMIAIVLY